MKINKHLKLLLLAGGMFGMITSCHKEVEVNSETTQNVMTNADRASMMKLGMQLKNPYTVDNMKIAWKNLVKAKKVTGTELALRKTHLYIKFMPRTDDQETLLKREENLTLYEYPLDYEILQEGDFYRDPSLPAEQPDYQYASVKAGTDLPNVPYQVIAELYIPQEDEKLDYENEGPKSATVDLLVDEALRITDNLDDDETSTRRGGKWRPSGTIKVWDDYFANYLALQGVEVRARRWFRTRKGITNASGYYSGNGKFRRKARYSIKWERYHFRIRKGWLSTAKHRGPKKKGSWNWNIKNGRQEYYATIFRAGYHYYYKNIKGLRRPPKNGFFRTQMKIRAYYQTNTEINGSHMEERRFLGLGSQIKIYNPHKNSRDIYGTTIHELAHASHWNMYRSRFDNSDKIVKESWARGVQRELTRMVYSSYSPSYFGNYTGVVQDMIDGKSGYDQVSGYSIRQIEDALKGQKQWNGWRDNIKNKYNNSSEGNLNALFSHWD